MADDFDQAMDDADWAEVYERQAARGDLVPELCELLDLSSGDPVLELGPGPGYASVRLGERVAPAPVYAVDRQPGALAYLVGKTGEAGVGNVRPVLGDAGALPVRFAAPTAALAAFVLHHVEDPARAVDEAAGALPDGSPLLVVEYRPDAPGEVGPPLDHRIAPRRVRSWLGGAGFAVEGTVDLPEEKYAVRARRGSD